LVFLGGAFAVSIFVLRRVAWATLLVFFVGVTRTGLLVVLGSFLATLDKWVGPEACFFSVLVILLPTLEAAAALSDRVRKEVVSLVFGVIINVESKICDKENNMQHSF
jgi:hypothetical protein